MRRRLLITAESEVMATIFPGAHAPDTDISEIEAQIRRLQSKLDVALQRRGNSDAPVDPVVSLPEKEVQRHQILRKGFLAYLSEYNPFVVLTAPVIYSTFIALVILDVFITVYQWTCFPVYGLGRVKRREYIVIDRHQLAYLNALEKFNCVFCGYANGVLAYGLEIASQTEHFWCPIKHAAKTRGLHPRAEQFVGYTDAAGYRRKQIENGKLSKCRACKASSE